LPSTDHDKLYAGLISELERILRPGKVLSRPEDIYVYSHYGAFGVNRATPPSAVLRVSSSSVYDNLKAITESYGLETIRHGENAARFGSSGLDVRYLIIDDQESLDSLTLQRRVSEIDEEQRKAKSSLRSSISFPHWFVDSQKSRDGFAVHERTGRERDFCVVQRFFDGVETYSSRGRLLLSRGLLGEEVEPSKRLVDSLYTCTACGQCFEGLGEGGLEVNNAIIKARCELASRGWGPSYCRPILENVRAEGNPMGMPAEDRAIWWEEVEEDHPFQGNEVLYWPGCTTSYRLPGIVEATAKLMEEAELDFGLLGEGEGCCGLILYLMGLWDEARENALGVSETLGKLGARLLVTNCAGCFYAFSRVFPKLGVEPGFGVLHTSQLMKRAIAEGPLAPGGVSGKFLWHDPCDLGRHCGVYDEPRGVLGAVEGLEVVEAPLSRDHTICCGGGGGLMAYNLELSEWVSGTKYDEEISRLDIDGIVTGCPACILNIRSALRSRESGIPVMDLSELLVKGL